MKRFFAWTAPGLAVLILIFQPLSGAHFNPVVTLADRALGTRLSAVAILAHKSILQNAQPFDVPDFSKEEDCIKWQSDRTSPYYGSDGRLPDIPCCSNPGYAPSEYSLNLFREALAKRNLH